MAFATVTSKGQVTIPAEVRAAAGITVGTRLEFFWQKDGVVGMVPHGRTLADLYGTLPAPDKPVSDREASQALAAGLAADDERTRL
jgi:AbrB family looped-hinge helix DNA binding protein